MAESKREKKEAETHFVQTWMQNAQTINIINILKCKVISISTVGDSWGVGRDLKCRSHQI